MFPHERSLVKRLEDKAFALLGINSDPDKEKLRQKNEEAQITWRSWWDKTTSGPIATKWNVRSWPTLYVIDHKGVIRHKYIGSPGDKVLDEAIDKLVEEAVSEKKTR
jgi:AhpC/TSA family protein